MSYKVTVSINGGWVHTHLDEGVTPVQILQDLLKTKYNGFEVMNEQASELVFAAADAVDCDALRTELGDFFAARYPNDVISGTIKVTPGGEAGEGAPPEKPAAEDKPSEDKPSEDKPGEDKPGEDKPGEGNAQKPAERQCKALADIDKLAGGAEFKELAHEVANVIPVINANNTAGIFTHQCYLFSINDGCGLTTYLQKFNELLAEAGLRSVVGSNKPTEEKIPPARENFDPFDSVSKILRGVSGRSTRMICIDISEWMNNTENKAFKDFIVDVSHHLDNNIVIFRIPFVEKDVLERVRFSLNDLLFIRAVSVPPFTKAELQACAEKFINDYGFTVTKSAWEYFHERITEERGDGRFYGLHTVKKVVRELLYGKQRDNAQKGRTDKAINKTDTRRLCRVVTDGTGGFKLFDKLIGCEPIKQRFEEIVAQIELSLKNPDLDKPCVHMRFVGNPGTGKTTVARIVGKVLKEKGVLSIGNFFEYSGRDLCGRYIGETAPKTASICRDAYGSVLFIDEAYSLYRGEDNERDFGREALDTLVAEMENNRSNFVVIMAGYVDDMDKLMRGNHGLASRMPYTVEFPNYTREQLSAIYMLMLGNKFKYEEGLESAVKLFFTELDDSIITSKEFSNARYVRNLFERTCAKAAMRCQLAGKTNIRITIDDFKRASADKEFGDILGKRNRIGFMI